MDNYEPQKGVPEVITAQERTEESAFVEACLATGVMRALGEALICSGELTGKYDFQPNASKKRALFREKGHVPRKKAIPNRKRNVSPLEKGNIEPFFNQKGVFLKKNPACYAEKGT